MQHLRRAFHRYLRAMHQGRVPQSSLRKMSPLQRLLPVRIAPAGGVALAILLLGAFSMMAAPKILVHAHRGGRAMRPENTLPAFEYAIGIGVDVLELDMAV